MDSGLLALRMYGWERSADGAGLPWTDKICPNEADLFLIRTAFPIRRKARPVLFEALLFPWKAP